MASRTRVGTVIDNKYRLDEQIGHGGMGAVYLGTQLMVDRKVAVKLLHPTFAAHENIQARFEVEAKAIGRLNHPNCITLFDFGYSSDLEAFYTVVEFIQGLSLDSLLGHPPPVADTVAIIRQIASALDHAHHHGVLHRDLKPENIMLYRMTDGSEMVKVLDFGIAQIMKGPTDGPGDDDFEVERLTRVGEVFGTPPYMSPEQASAARDLTPAADLYSLGVIFYELIEGRLPFFADNPLDIMLMHINTPPPPFAREGVPKEVVDLVFSLLEKDPDNRPQAGKAIIKSIDSMPHDIFLVTPAAASPSHVRQEPQTTPDAGRPGELSDTQKVRSEPTLPDMPEGVSETPHAPRQPQGPIPTEVDLDKKDEESEEKWAPVQNLVLADEISSSLTDQEHEVEDEWSAMPTAAGTERRKSLLPMIAIPVVLLLLITIVWAFTSGDSQV
ncbi:MAG: serine/threonine protein kinase, partial [Bradymonadaceae bacterium]